MTLLIALAIGLIADTWRLIFISTAVATGILAAIRLPAMFDVASELGIRDPSSTAVVLQLLIMVVAVASAIFSARRFLKNRAN